MLQASSYIKYTSADGRVHSQGQKYPPPQQLAAPITAVSHNNSTF